MTRAPSWLFDERGVSALEFAMVLPVLLAFVGGIIEYGRTLFAEHQVRDIIDDAVRTGVVTGASASDVRQNVTASLNGLNGLESYSVNVTDGANLTVTVTATIDYVFAGVLPDDSLAFVMTSQFPR